MINIKKLIEDVIGDLANNQPLDSVSSKVQVISRSLRNDKFIKHSFFLLALSHLYTTDSISKRSLT